MLPVGRIRLGGEQAQTEFSRLSWLAMLFAAGMGIGLMFWGVAAPMAYFTGWAGTPFNVTPWSNQAAELAMASTIYHWGFHAWAIYGVAALALAFFAYNCGLPLTLRSAFYPLIGEHCWRWPGHVINAFQCWHPVWPSLLWDLAPRRSTQGCHCYWVLRMALRSNLPSSQW